MLVWFLISLLTNYRFFYFRAKTSFLISLNFSYCKPKFIKKNLDVYNSIGENFISVTYKSFYNEKNIIIGYTSLYIYKKNGIIEQC